MAVALLSETNLRGDVVKPLIHVIGEAEGYQIQYETQTATASSRHPFVVITFQRSLKHHALFHCLFGHELGHTALQTPSAGSVLNSHVIAAFTSSGPLSSIAAMNRWAKSPAGKDIEEAYRESWLEELSCDLFCLVLFGPAFLAAHRTYLSPLDPDPYYIDFSGPTHPPYAVRQKMLRRRWSFSVGTIPLHTMNSSVNSCVIFYMTPFGLSLWSSMIRSYIVPSPEFDR